AVDVDAERVVGEARAGREGELLVGRQPPDLARAGAEPGGIGRRVVVADAGRGRLGALGGGEGGFGRRAGAVCDAARIVGGRDLVFHDGERAAHGDGAHRPVDGEAVAVELAAFAIVEAAR